MLPQNEANNGSQSKAQFVRGHLSGLSGLFFSFLPFSLSLSVSLLFSCHLWLSRIGDEIEIVTYSRVPFVRTSTSRHRGAQLHRRPIVPQSRFVTVTYAAIYTGIERWEIGVIVSDIVLRNELRVLELCSRVFSSRCGRGGKVLSNTPPVGTVRTQIGTHRASH